MVAFLKQHTGYKAGVVALFVTTILFLVGNFDPNWLHHSETETNKGNIWYRTVSAHSSALAGCSKGKENGTTSGGGSFSRKYEGCGLGFYVDAAAGGWVHACQAFEWIGIIVLLLACIYTIWVNFCKAELGPRRRYVEIATIAAGVLGFLGSVIFAGKMGGTVKDSPHYSFAWSLFFTIFISIAIVVVGAVMAIFNGRDGD